LIKASLFTCVNLKPNPKRSRESPKPECEALQLRLLYSLFGKDKTMSFCRRGDCRGLRDVSPSLRHQQDTNLEETTIGGLRRRDQRDEREYRYHYQPTMRRCFCDDEHDSSAYTTPEYDDNKGRGDFVANHPSTPELEIPFESNHDGMLVAGARFGHTKPEPFSRKPYKQLSFDKKANYSSENYDRTIEVFPGEFLRLRGADETWRAIQVDFYMPCECVCCLDTIFCIQDADFVLCPNCRVVSPMAGVSHEGSDGGVGLGFTMSDLACFQSQGKKEKSLST